MLTRYAKLIREKYTAIIISTLVLGILVGLFTPAPGLAIRKVSTFLIVIMIGAMGFTITFKSLGTAARDWKPFILGVVLNFVFAPLHRDHLFFRHEKPAHSRGDCLPDAYRGLFLSDFPAKPSCRKLPSTRPFSGREETQNLSLRVPVSVASWLSFPSTEGRRTHKRLPDPRQKVVKITLLSLKQANQKFMSGVRFHFQLPAVQTEEYIRCKKGYSLVPINKGMVHQERLKKRRRHFSKVLVVACSGAI